MTDSNIVLKGKLSFLNLAELIQLLGGSGSTGILKLSSTHAKGPGYIYVVDGNPIDAAYQDKNGREVFNDFFGWLDAEFEFSEEKILHRKTIQKNRMELILDGLRMLDDDLIDKLGHAHTPAKKSKIDLKDDAGIPIIKGPLVDYLYVLDEDEFSEGQEIVVQEKYGNWLWVILEGTVEVFRTLPEGRVTISKLSEGGFIGSIGSLKEKTYVRSATVKALTRVQLGVLDYHQILNEFSRMSECFQEVLFSIENRLIQVTTECTKAQFKKIKIFPDMGDFKQLKASEIADDKILRITAGKAVVVKPANKQFIQLCRLKSGDFIGDIPFLTTSHEPYSAQVFISGDFESEKIDLIDLKEEYNDLSLTLKNMILHTSTCLAVTSGRLIDILKNSKSKQ